MLINIRNKELLSGGAYPLSFETLESISSSPMYTLTFQSPEAGIDLVKILGKLVEVEIDNQEGGLAANILNGIGISGGLTPKRTFSLYVVSGTDTGQMGEFFTYELELSTWIWFLKQNRNSKIFQDMNVIEIIKDIFSRYNLADYRMDVKGNYPKNEYTVQFNETDFDFVNRLLEYEGIWYYFDQKDGKNTLVITDNQQFPNLDKGYQSLDFIPDGEEKRAIREGIQKINRNNKVHPTRVVLRDFDYLNPKKDLQINIQDNQSIDIKDSPLEWYDYSQNYLSPNRGKDLAQIRLEEMTSFSSLLEGESNAIGLSPGRSFSLSLHPDKNKNIQYKIIETNYLFVQDGPDSTNSKGRNIFCKFKALDSKLSFRPLRATQRPDLPGIQSATVVGPVQSEVHTDKHGRIRVHFHWDRYKTNEENSSCWIRVIQAWAGKGWGVLAMPRVGQEVLVTYVDGDMDRPMVMGIVYNGDNPPPYELPKHTNYSGLVSRSLENGIPRNANLFTMDDKRNNERIMLHAERDKQEISERNDAKFVGQDLYEVVKRITTKVFNAHFSFKNYSFSMTGVSNSFTGVSTSHTGISLSTTGISTSFTGLSTSFTGSSTSFTGNSLSFTGNSTSFTGNSTSFTGHSTSMTGKAESYTGKSYSVTGESESYTGTSTSTVGTSTSQVGSSTSTTGSSVSTTGSSMSTTGSSVSTTGSSVSTTGSSVSTTGSSVSTTGSSVSTTGSSNSTTGSSCSTVGSSTSTVGMSNSTTGVSISFVGVSIHKTGIDIKL